MYLISVCFSFQVYNEDINDLLCPLSKREPLAIREDYSGRIWVLDYTIYMCYFLLLLI